MSAPLTSRGRDYQRTPALCMAPRTSRRSDGPIVDTKPSMWRRIWRRG